MDRTGFAQLKHVDAVGVLFGNKQLIVVQAEMNLGRARVCGAERRGRTWDRH